MEEMAKVCHGGRDVGRDGQVCAVLLHECSLMCVRSYMWSPVFSVENISRRVHCVSLVDVEE